MSSISTRTRQSVSLLALLLAACGYISPAAPTGLSSAVPTTLTSTPRMVAASTDTPSRAPTATLIKPVTPLPSAGATPSPITWPAPNGRVAFSAKSYGIYQVYVVNADGTNLVQITHDQESDHFVQTWLPDGQGLIFGTSAPNGQQIDAIWVVSLDGTGKLKLTADYPSAWGPSVSPDGQNMVFVSAKDGNDDLYVMELNSRQVSRLTDSPAYDYSPQWSPDGTAIVFESLVAQSTDIYSVHPDGSQLQQLTNSPADDINPVWSPDGRRLAFIATTPLTSEVWIINADGSDPHKISRLLSANFPYWSPDGQQLSFSGADLHSLSAGVLHDIYRFSINNSALTQITNSTSTMEYWGLGWSPDGNWLVMIAGPSLGAAQLYLLAPDGSSMAPLVQSPIGEVAEQAVWQPQLQ